MDRDSRAMTEGHVRIRGWEEFKRLVSEKKPGSIVFILEQAGFSPNKELTAIKLIMLHDKRYYIFIDSAQGQSLRQMGVPFHKDKNGIPNLDEDEVKAFLEKTFAADNVKVFSFWTY